jgi:hypothetical protein
MEGYVIGRSEGINPEFSWIVTPGYIWRQFTETSCVKNATSLLSQTGPCVTQCYKKFVSLLFELVTHLKQILPFLI